MKLSATPKSKPKTRYPRILVLCLTDPSGNPRPRRLVEFGRKEGFHISVAGFPRKSSLACDAYYEFKRPSLKFFHRLKRKLLRTVLLVFKSNHLETLLEEARWKLTNIGKKLEEENFSAIIVEDIHLLPFAFKIQNGARIVMDAREYYPREFESGLFWRLTERPHRIRVCREFLPRCDAILTVSPGLAVEYQKEFGITPHLLRSTPAYCDIKPDAPRDGKIRMVHHGIANKDRKLETMIELFRYLDDRFSLDFYLMGSSHYIKKLKEKAKPFPGIRFMNPVPLPDIIPTVNAYDVGLCFFYPATFNLRHCLPNKLFEFIQARLAVAIGPSPDMADIVRQYQCGFVSDNFDIKAMAEMLNGLGAEQIWQAKQASHKAAQDLCYEKEVEKIRPLLTGSP